MPYSTLASHVVTSATIAAAELPRSCWLARRVVLRRLSRVRDARPMGEQLEVNRFRVPAV